MSQGRAHVTGLPLLPWERDGLSAALAKAGLASEDVKDPGTLFWRFETGEMPAGFGGLEIHGDQALLRSVLTLPPLRRRGFGRAIVEALELEARVRGCRTIWLATAQTEFFERLGYREWPHDDIPKAVRETAQFAALNSPSMCAMKKQIE